jgi:Glucose / Sorbosone dehydrogenase
MRRLNWDPGNRKILTGCMGFMLCVSQLAFAQMTLEIADYAVMPMTGLADGKGSNDVLLARVNALREEPGGANRFFVTDLNGPLYILSKGTKKFTTYLDFNGHDGRPGIFHKLFTDTGYGNGLNGFYFDPDYRRNGKFYTVHIEDPAATGSNLPDNKNFPGLNVSGYTTTSPIPTPGPTLDEGVLVEWTDSNISNDTFEGTAREILRVQLNTRAHPLGDIIFNPTAKTGDPDWRVLYVNCGDGGAGEATSSIRSNPQRLDNLVGKILRIIPDLREHTATSTVSENGRYRIPNDNPFVSKAGARKEIWAYGLRNPHRLNWATDPANPANNHLLANSVGLHTWESVYVIRKGANYGYSLREGNEVLKSDNTTTSLPGVDRIPVQISDITEETVVPTYPVIQYGHVAGGGDAIGSGFVYNGKAIPSLQGKYLFTDITTGRIWYAEYREMLAADDGKPGTTAPIHEVKILWKNPNDTLDAGRRVFDTMFPIAQAAYQSRGGKDPDLPGRGTVSGQGRTDARFAIDSAGELYLYSKTDGVIRAVVGASGK